MSLFWIVLIVMLGVLVYHMVRSPGGGAPPEAGPRDTPLDILKRRYASGELSREEFESIKRDLES